MKRDMDLVRDLLLYFEAKPDPHVARPDEIEIEGYDQLDVHYHVVLMCEAGLLECERVESSTTPSRLVDVYPFGLTWAGHEFLDASRNETRWNQAKAILKGNGLSVGFAVLQALLVSLTTKQLGLS